MLRWTMLETTLCYIENNNSWLMLHRVKKSVDANKDKWIGVGGKLEPGETPDECMLREVFEETGLKLKEYEYRGIVDFCSDMWPEELMHLYTAKFPGGELKDCDEGTLEWVPFEKIDSLPIWEGDKVFFKLLKEDAAFFRLRLEYEGEKLVKWEL